MNTTLKTDSDAVKLKPRDWQPQDPAGEVVARFEVRYRRYLDANGALADNAPPLAEDSATLTRLYQAMVLARVFDQKAIAMQRTGELRTYPSCQGQEAIAVGVASAMVDDDVLLSGGSRSR